MDTSEPSVHRIINGWVSFLATVFKLSFLLHETGFGLTDIIVDATEFKAQIASNRDCTSRYGNIIQRHYTQDQYLISEMIEKSRVLEFVEQDHEIMSDKGFAIQDLCAIQVRKKEISLTEQGRRRATNLRGVKYRRRYIAEP